MALQTFFVDTCGAWIAVFFFKQASEAPMYELFLTCVSQSCLYVFMETNRKASNPLVPSHSGLFCLYTIVPETFSLFLRLSLFLSFCPPHPPTPRDRHLTHFLLKKLFLLSAPVQSLPLHLPLVHFCSLLFTHL